MVRKKYIRDYRLVETVDEQGRIRSDYEYIGEEYVYCLGVDAVRRERRLALGFTAAGWLAFVGGLIPNAAGMRVLWVALPYLFAALPLGILTDTLLTAAPDAEPLRRQQADMLENRLPPAALFSAILSGAALAGELIRSLFAGAFPLGDVLFSLCAAVLCAAPVCVFSRRTRFSCRKK